MSYIYMQVTKDEYELPKAIAYSVKDLSKITGKPVNCISVSIWRRKKFHKKGEFVKVKIDDLD